jgi:hypothetical protein
MLRFPPLLFAVVLACALLFILLSQLRRHNSATV